jgi:hypothetical protein
MAYLAQLTDTDIGKQTVMPTPNIMGPEVQGAQIAQLHQQTQAGYQNQAIQQQQNNIAMQRQQQLRDAYSQSIDPTTGQPDPHLLTKNLYLNGLGPEGDIVNEQHQKNLLTQAQAAHEKQATLTASTAQQIADQTYKINAVGGLALGLQKAMPDLWTNPERYDPKSTLNPDDTLTKDQQLAVAKQIGQKYPGWTQGSNLFPSLDGKIGDVQKAGYAVPPVTISAPDLAAYSARYEKAKDMGFEKDLLDPDQFKANPVVGKNMWDALFDESTQRHQLLLDAQEKSRQTLIDAQAEYYKTRAGNTEAKTNALENRGAGGMGGLSKTDAATLKTATTSSRSPYVQVNTALSQIDMAKTTLSGPCTQAEYRTALQNIANATSTNAASELGQDAASVYQQVNNAAQKYLSHPQDVLSESIRKEELKRIDNIEDALRRRGIKALDGIKQSLSSGGQASDNLKELYSGFAPKTETESPKSSNQVNADHAIGTIKTAKDGKSYKFIGGNWNDKTNWQVQ